MDEATNVLLVGPPGVGKTHLAIGLGIKACIKLKRVKFYHAEELLNVLMLAQLAGRLGKELWQLSRLDLLIVDELGYMKMGKDTGSLFFQLVCRRYEKGSLILTTNCPFEEWGSIFDDSIMATAILDRLLTGKSYRMKDYQSSKKGKCTAGGEPSQ
jgi:DNA replication protein DnaC